LTNLNEFQAYLKSAYGQIWPFFIFLDLATLHQILLHNIAGLAATRMASSQQQEQQQQQQLFRVRENMYITCLRG